MFEICSSRLARSAASSISRALSAEAIKVRSARSSIKEAWTASIFSRKAL